MTIKEKNEFIARYMGYEQNPNHPKYPNTTYWFKGNEVLTILLYDKSYDWIIPVYKKIYEEMIGDKTINEMDCIEENFVSYQNLLSSTETIFNLCYNLLQLYILQQCVGKSNNINKKGKTTSSKLLNKQ